MTTTSNFKFRRVCAECSCEFGANRANAEFCSTACKGKFNNRRAMRGSELYDLVMEMRYGSGNGREKEAFALICKLAEGFREEDKRSRGGKRSWAKLQTRLNEMNRLPGVPDGR